MTTSVFDVAAYILKKQGEMTAMKLQKLCYYAQAWSLVWDEQPLFSEPIEAWAMGPVVPALYMLHRKQFRVTSLSRGNPDVLSDEQRETIDIVLGFYGNRTAQWLSDLTHSENPWKLARRGLGPTDQGCEEISHADMVEYYSSLSSGQLLDR